MRTFTLPLCVICMLLTLDTSAFAQTCSQTKGTYATYGDIVVDTKTKLAWKRCSVGQTWTGVSCSGQAAGFTFRDALDFSGQPDEGFTWRIPKPDELATLVVNDPSCVPAIDQEAFPRTAPNIYWTGTAPPKTPDAAFCQSFRAGSSVEREQCWTASEFAVRLVSALPLNGYAPTAPTASSFAIDASGKQLVVMGSHFSRTVAHNLVNVTTSSGITPVVPIAGSETLLTIVVPDDATTGSITVTTRGATSLPARGTLRVISSKDGCAAAGFTPAVMPVSEWDYCIFANGFTDDPADVLIIGAHPGKLKDLQPSYILSTSHLAKAAAASVTLSGSIVLQYGASGRYGALAVHSNAGLDADSLTTTGVVSNNGAVYNRGNFTSMGSLLNTGNGVIFNSGVFTNNAGPETGVSISTTGRAINNVSFSNVSAANWPRAQLRNMGTLATASGSTGIDNAHGDVINNGTLLLEGANVFVNRAGAAPGTVTNNGSILLRIGTQPEGIPILSNEPGATIVNNAGASIVNARTTWTFANRGSIQNCGRISGDAPGPNGYGPCRPTTRRSP